MLAQKIILGFGFAVVLPLLVHYGIEAFHPSVPTPESYDEVRRLRQREEQSTGDEKVQLRDQRERMEAELRTQERASSHRRAASTSWSSSRTAASGASVSTSAAPPGATSSTAWSRRPTSS